MGLLSYVRSRTQVNASRADTGAAAAASFMPDTKRGTYVGAPKRETGPAVSGPKPKRETGAPVEPTTPQVSDPKRDIGYEPYTKNLYSSNEPAKKRGPQRTPGSFGDGPATVWPQNGDGDRRSPIDRI